MRASLQPDRQLPVVHHFKANLAIKTCMDDWRSNVNANPQPRKGAFPLHPGGDLRVCMEIYIFSRPCGII
jgi:hypothetical protein